MLKFALVFPGQGSQSQAMMQGYGDSVAVRSAFDEASDALGRDLWTLMMEGDAETLSRTINTQPLMLTAGVAVYRLWLEKGGSVPAMLAGHSLGEYSALVAAGAMSLRQAAPLVERRAAAMQDAVPSGEGGMAAILGLDAATVSAVCAAIDSATGGASVVAAVNFNEPKQTVIAGHKSAVEQACEALKAKGAKRAMMLPVSAPFHCALMQPAALALQAHLRPLTLQAPQIPLINNVDVAALSDPEAIKDALVRQVAAPVRWVETVQAMQAQGVTHIFECGPGKVLTGLVKRCVDGVVAASMPDLAAVEAALAMC